MCSYLLKPNEYNSFEFARIYEDDMGEDLKRR